MIFMRDEISGHFFNLKVLQEQYTTAIKKYQKNIDNPECPSQLLNLDETLNLIEEYQNELRNIIEMQKVPFDVLIVIQKRK